MSNVQSGGGVKVPTFQPASGKGDGQGNGSGGMYFGQDQQQQDQQQHNPWLYRRNRFHEVDTGDIPYQLPIPEASKEVMGSWLTAVAKLLYQRK